MLPAAAALISVLFNKSTISLIFPAPPKAVNGIEYFDKRGFATTHCQKDSLI